MTAYRQQLPSVVPTPGTETPAAARFISGPCDVEDWLPSVEQLQSALFANASITVARFSQQPKEHEALAVEPIGRSESSGATSKGHREVHQFPSPELRELVSATFREVKVFGTELLLGIAICVAAALQRRLARAHV
eukprot:CAMPEP_0181413804 /NCGR_PEP_ID=MMETSP1110-20121109/9168_1 /TAXON_ID=174948 /ORGANISM="Symbiodinium sp., Strain CCMP421" /LENGTH=135 /DNA_ID=CAMNT_0023536643 /DNA_START=140 /DNA_END=547 /DNA_ORIENTATION=+